MLIKPATTPLRLAAITCCGSMLAVGGFLLVGKGRDSLSFLLSGAGLALVGLFFVYWTPYQLGQGVRNDEWSEEQLLPLRRIVDHVVWKALTFLLVLAMIASFIVEPRLHRRFFWAIFLLLQTMTQLTNGLRRPSKPPTSTTRLDWSKVPPLQSEHWGER